MRAFVVVGAKGGLAKSTQGIVAEKDATLEA